MMLHRKRIRWKSKVKKEIHLLNRHKNNITGNGIIATVSTSSLYYLLRHISLRIISRLIRLQKC